MTVEADQVQEWLDDERAYAEVKWPADSALRTLLSATEAAVRIYGPLPPAGVSSRNLDGKQAA